MRTILLATALVLVAAPVYAQEEAGVVVTGEATLQPQLAAQLEGWLRGHGHRLVASPLDPDSINTLIDCFVLDDESCARNVVDRASRAPTLIYARIVVSPSDDGSRDITLVGYWLHKNQVHAVADKKVCEKCTDKELRGAADEMMATLSHLATPEGGTHEETAALHPSPAAGPEQPERVEEHSHTVPLVLIGGGAVAAAVGISFIVMGEQTPAKTGAQTPTYRDYTTPGYALGAIGLAALGAGVYLWLHEGASSAPVAAVSSSGGYVGWTGRF
jgi:hypothetical protein